MSRRAPFFVSKSTSLVLLALATACSAPQEQDSNANQHAANAPAAAPASTGAPLAGAHAVDALIQPAEKHFAHLWKLTDGVENAAEGYWSFGGDRLSYQATPNGSGCDRIFVSAPRGASDTKALQLSSGNGITTCSYFLPGDRAVLYASTHAYQVDCPPRPDMSQGYVWLVHPEYDIYVHDLASGRERTLTNSWGYDAEATISTQGDRIVFTSSRSGDLELWTCDLEGQHLKQVTNTPGYDGGAFFSHDGKWLVFRSTSFTPGKEAEQQAEYSKLLAEWKVRPTTMDIMRIRPDGSERQRVTNLGQASFAPYFFPDDQRIIFASNSHDKQKPAREFDLFAVDADGKNLEQITTYVGFDSFPMFSPDGRYLAFASNRGGSKPHETNLFIAQWR